MEAEVLDPQAVAWTRNLFDAMEIGGVWGIPRSGLMFTRTGEDEITLSATLPWQPEMEVVLAHDELVAQQRRELDDVVAHMFAAGVKVVIP